MNIKIGNIQIENVKNIVWDKDGTITNADVYWGEIVKRRANKLIQIYNLPQKCYQSLCECMGYSVRKSCLIEKGPVAILPLSNVLQAVKQFLEKMNITISEKELIQMVDTVNKEFLPYMDQYTVMLPDVKETMQLFRNCNCRQILLTSDTSANAEHAMQILGLSDYINSIYGRDKYDGNKSSGLPLIRIMDEFDWKKEETICIGDAFVDAQLADGAGIKGSILVASGQIPLEKLKEHSKYTVERLNKIIVEE